MSEKQPAVSPQTEHDYQVGMSPEEVFYMTSRMPDGIGSIVEVVKKVTEDHDKAIVLSEEL